MLSSAHCTHSEGVGRAWAICPASSAAVPHRKGRKCNLAHHIPAPSQGEVGRTLSLASLPRGRSAQDPSGIIWAATAQEIPAGPCPMCLFCFQAREQDVSRIIQALNECLAALPRQQLHKVGGIGVSGQMHGVLFWKTGQGMRGSGGDHTL